MTDEDESSEPQENTAQEALTDEEEEPGYSSAMEYPDEEIIIDESRLFPTHPAFTIPVEIKPTPSLGDDDQFGVFAAEDIPANTEFWVWTHRVVEIPSSQMGSYIEKYYAPDDFLGIRQFLRRGFVLPSPYDDIFFSNPTDAGTFMNHSSNPNCVRPHGTSRLVRKGEELTMDYSGNGNPEWYVDLCHQYGILTAVEIAEEERKRDGQVVPARYEGPASHSLLEKLLPF